jgi:3D-(3,5/4)-trihydroxycyclohexane-1,2-dione acylhydrolase (decyclizing)
MASFCGADLVAIARSLGAWAVQARDLGELSAALAEARKEDRTSVIVIETTTAGVPRYGSWWDVAVAEVSPLPEVRRARADYEEGRQKERYHLKGNARAGGRDL